ncbi:MAG TPA: anhydro-N-acetylmuramic acid kinase, partial [Rhodospirillaceae bacterium]|nr:anhydro-N-acetylmuramic acid kinase [Rhodospirillaceae bacterium]
GQGAPLVPLYHRALAAGLKKPTAIINIGGVSNITWIGGERDDELLAFDLGPGNALIDDWILRHVGENCDRDGVCAARGAVDEKHIVKFLEHPFFQVKPPKSLDRDVFAGFVPEGASVEDGAATLTMMSVAAIAKGLEAVPVLAREVYIAGGGRHNATMMRWLAERTGLSIKSVDALGWNGDAVEAEAFAYLAVRSVLGLPLSVPNTTRVSQPMTGGKLNKGIA